MTLFWILMGVFWATFLAAFILQKTKKQATENNQGRIQNAIILCRAISIIALIAEIIVVLNLD